MNWIFLIVGLVGLSAIMLMAFLVEANIISDKYLHRLGFGILGAMAVTVCALIFIEDDSEFDYGETSMVVKKKDSGQSGGGMKSDDGGDGPGEDGGGGDDGEAADAAGSDDGSGGGGSGGGGASGAGDGNATNKDCETCPAMVPVAAGFATIGSFMEVATLDAMSAPQVDVEMGRSFSVSQLEISRDEFNAFVVDAGYSVSSSQCLIYGLMQAAPSFEADPTAKNGKSPATCVTFNDANAYTKWLSKKSGKPYRLLSEAEWEYVAAVNSGTAKIPKSIPEYHRGRVGEVVALFSGAAEWVSDCASDVIKVAGNEDAGLQMTANLEACGERLTKGGSDRSSAESRAIGMRGRADAGDASAEIGFRVMRETVE